VEEYRAMTNQDYVMGVAPSTFQVVVTKTHINKQSSTPCFFEMLGRDFITKTELSKLNHFPGKKSSKI